MGEGVTRQEGPESLGQLDTEAMPAAPGIRRSLPAHVPAEAQPSTSQLPGALLPLTTNP